MGNFFSMDSKFFTFMGKVADLMILNVLCIICCIPIVTAGPAITAMFYVTLKMVRNEESYIVKGFFKSFKENLKQGILINLIMLLFGALILIDLRIMGNMEGSVYKALYTVFLAFGVVYIMIFLYIYPVLAKFYNSIKNTFVNALLMSIRHLPYTFLMALVTAAPVAAIIFIPSEGVQSGLMLAGIMIGFSLVAYINSYFFVKIFDNYIPKEEEMSEEERWENLEVIGNQENASEESSENAPETAGEEQDVSGTGNEELDAAIREAAAAMAAEKETKN